MANVSADRAPALNSPSFDCPMCGVYANQAWGAAVALLHTGGNARIESDGVELSTAQCYHCHGFSLWLSDRMVYPLAMVGAEASMDMPEDVKSIYNEARAVAAVSRRAGAAMARATLELLLKEIDPEAPKNASLVERLDRIIPTVDTALGQMLTFVRHVGNAIHVSEQPDDAVVMVLDDDQTAGMDLIFAAVNALVDEKITRPRVSADMYAKIPESVRERVERSIRPSPSKGA